MKVFSINMKVFSINIKVFSITNLGGTHVVGATSREEVLDGEAVPPHPKHHGGNNDEVADAQLEGPRPLPCRALLHLPPLLLF